MEATESPSNASPGSNRSPSQESGVVHPAYSGAIETNGTTLFAKDVVVKEYEISSTEHPPTLEPDKGALPPQPALATAEDVGALIPEGANKPLPEEVAQDEEISVVHKFDALPAEEPKFSVENLGSTAHESTERSSVEEQKVMHEDLVSSVVHEVKETLPMEEQKVVAEYAGTSVPNEVNGTTVMESKVLADDPVSGNTSTDASLLSHGSDKNEKVSTELEDGGRPAQDVFVGEKVPELSNEKVSKEKHHSEATNLQAVPRVETAKWPSVTSKPTKPGLTGVKKVAVKRALVDTAAPFESVREAVSKFGGSVDWKAQKAKSLEKKKQVENELQKVQREAPLHKKELEDAEAAKSKVLEELVSTKRLIEDLKVQLERAQVEEEQAKQDAQFAQMRVDEIQQGIADEVSVAAKAQLETAISRHESAVSELKSVKNDLDVLHKEYQTLIVEKDKAIKKAENAVSASKETEKVVEDLTLELIAAKESLELAHASHMEAEEHRLTAIADRDQEGLKWEKDIKAAEEEIQRLTEQLSKSNFLKTRLETASGLLLNLKAELAAFMEANLESEKNAASESTHISDLQDVRQAEKAMDESIVSAEKELEDVQASIEKAKEEVKCLRVAANSLKAELESEKSSLTVMRQREGIAGVTVSSLESDLEKARLELASSQAREKGMKEKMLELPKLLQEAAQEADDAKSLAKSAEDELWKVKEEAEMVKAGLSTAESRLHATMKEIEAAKASEKLALAAIKALQESETASSTVDSSAGVNLSVDEYYELSKKAHEAEELANSKVAAAFMEIEAAKSAEAKSLAELEEANREVLAKREALRVAMEKAEKAKQGKLGAEQELRVWRSDHGQRRRASNSHSDLSDVVLNHWTDPETIKEFEGSLSDGDSRTFGSEDGTDSHASDTNTKKKKRSIFPRIGLLLARKKGNH